LYLSREHLDSIIDHAKAESPNEVCGIIAGHEGQTVKVYAGKNVEQNSDTRFSMDPQQQFGIMQEMAANGWEMMAIYHSHPTSPAYPSETDVNLAYYPDAVCLIVSLAISPPEARAFRIVDGMISNEQLIVN
jgi:[CysO sulfur-carrier protein]-S-L-cysteine hydrolase